MKKLIISLIFIVNFFIGYSQYPTCYSGELLINGPYGYSTVGGGHSLGDTLLFKASFAGLKYSKTNIYTIDTISYRDYSIYSSLIDTFRLSPDTWSNDTSYLPFLFNFFGCSYNSFNISENGILTFDPYVIGGSFINDTISYTIPDTNYPNASIMSNFQSLIQNRPIKTYIFGTAPCREFIVKFDSSSYKLDSCGRIRYSTSIIVLHEKTNIIDIYTKYQFPCSSLNNGRAITGIQNYGGTIAYEVPGRNNTVYTDTFIGYRYYPVDTFGIINKIVFIVNDTIRYDSAYVPFTADFNLSTNFKYILNRSPISFKAILYSLDTLGRNCSMVSITGTGLGTGSSSGGGTDGEATNGIGIGGGGSGGGGSGGSCCGIGCGYIAARIISTEDIYTFCNGDQIPGSVVYSIDSSTYPINNSFIVGDYEYTPGGYTITIIDSYGCSTSLGFTIGEIIQDPPVLYITSTQDAYCTGTQGSIFYNIDDGNAPYSISYSDGISTYYDFSITGIGSLDNLSQGIYNIEIVDDLGCIDSNSVEIFSVNMPTYFDTTIYTCRFVDVDMGYNIFNTAGVYYDTIENYFTCDSIITTTVLYNPPVYEYQYIEMCEGDFINVGINSYYNQGTYEDTLYTFEGCDSIITTDLEVHYIDYTYNVFRYCYDTIISVGIHNYDSTGIYRDSLLNTFGCDSFITSDIYIYKDPSPRIIHICKGDSLYYIRLDTNTTLNYYYLNFNGCDSLYSINIIVDSLPVVNIGNDTSIYDDEYFTLYSPNYYSLWNTGDTANSLFISPFTSTSFWVYVIDTTTGCVSADTINVLVSRRMTELAIPNAFTPNGDGLNDFFFPVIRGYYYIEDFKIFNRYGNLVFENAGNHVWDGTFLNDPQPIGTYVYYLDIIQLDRTHKKLTGTVELIR